MKNVRPVLIFIAIVFMASCHRDKIKYTQSGMLYIVYRENSGVKPRLGDYITFEMVYKNDADSVLFDSRVNKSPFRIQLVKIPFEGSMEEGLTYLSEGDSATFFVSADSLIKNIFKNPETASQRESILKPGSLVRFDIHLVRVQSKAEAEKEIAEDLQQRKNAEAKLLGEYLEKNQITTPPDSNGIYCVTEEYFSGKINDGDTVFVYYESRYLDGTIWDSNRNRNEPLSFIVGANQVVRGWEIAVKNLDVHSRAVLILPSSMAYGARGLLNASSGTFVVPPYVSLVYEVEIADVKRKDNPVQKH